MTASDPNTPEEDGLPEMGAFGDMGAEDPLSDGMPMGGDMDAMAEMPAVGMEEPQMDDAGADFGAPLEGEVSAGPVAQTNGFNEESGAEKKSRKAVLGVPIEVVIAVGKARPLLSELVNLRRDSVLSLDSKIEDPVEIMVGDRVIARGELQELDDSGRLGVRLIEVADLSNPV